MSPGGDEVDLTEGWDSLARIVDGTWLERRPRRASVEPRLRREVALLAWLGPQLPLPVPRPVVVAEDPLTVRHRLLPGTGSARITDRQAAQLGEFFARLHAADVEAAVALGVPDAQAAHHDLQRDLERFAVDVLPLLGAAQQAAGRRLLDRLAPQPRHPALTHADVGPAHLLQADGVLTGVIDWSDAAVGDPAKDLAWLLHGSGRHEAVAAGYGATPALARRALDWHRLGPWWEVVHGLDEGRDDFVERGLDGVRNRLTLP